MPQRVDLSVVPGSSGPEVSAGLKAALRHGSAEIGVGAAAAGFGVEAIKTVVTGAPLTGWWWLAALTVVGVALVLFGFRLRYLRSRPTRMGLVVCGLDERRDLAWGR